MSHTIDTTAGDNGKTLYRIAGPSFAAVQNAVVEVMNDAGHVTSQFNLPRRVDDHFEAHGFTIAKGAGPVLIEF